MQTAYRHTAAILLFLNGAALRADEIEVPKPLDDRLKVELFAAEPDIVTVTGLTVDAKERVLVVESHTHFRPDDYDGPETDRIRLLEDTDGDGQADRIETFFSGTTSTMNIAAHPNGWVYVATRDSMFRLRDKDDDGRADEKQMLVRLETTSDYPHNGLSGFAFDFSGNVYFGFGENMGQDATLVGGPGHVYLTLGQNYAEDAELVDAKGRRLPALRGSGGVFRCREDGSELERIATGFWNPFHLCFDAFGRMFVGDNDPGNRPPCRFLSIVEGGDYGYRRRTLEPFIAINAEVPGTLPMTSSTGESPTGMIAYESDHLPGEYRGEILVATWGEHRIDRYRLRREGASFTVTTKPMIAGGEHFRPAGIVAAPDGSLYVGDWADRSYPLHGKGRVWHITRRTSASGANTSQGESSREPDIRAADLRQRDDAARRLLKQGESGVARLLDAVKNDADARVRSVGLSALISADAVTKSLANRVLSDSSESVREQAVRTLPKHVVDFAAIARIDDSPAVQAAALRRIADPNAELLLITRLAHPDPFMQQAARHGLDRSVNTERLLELTSDPRPEVRLAAVLLLRGGPNVPLAGDANPIIPTSPRTMSGDTNKKLNGVITRALSDTDASVRFAAVEWIGRDRLRHFRQPLIEGLSRGATTPQLFTAYLAALAQLDGVMQHWTKGTVGDWWAKEANSHEYAARLLDNSRTSPAVLRQVLLFLPPKHPALRPARLQMLMESDDVPLRLESVRVLRGIDSEEANSIVSALARDESAAPDLRAEAVIGLQPSRSDDRDLLLELAFDEDRAVCQEALRTLRSAKLSDSQRERLAALRPNDNATEELLQRLLTPSPASDRPSTTDIDKWLALLDGEADPNAGQRVFFHRRGPGCSKCHRIDGRGTAIGPSFERMNGRLSLTRRRLVEAILRPSKDIGPGYLPITILTVDGKIASGIYHKHSGKVRQIYDSEGKIQTFKIEDIEELAPSKISIMPDGLADTMTLQEFRDLLAYLDGRDSNLSRKSRSNCAVTGI